jgi:ABC-2 type transport system permease protein
MTRIAPLVAKEFLDIRRNRAALLPVAIVTILAVALPFVIAIGVPAWSGQPLSDDADLVQVSGALGTHGQLPALSGDAQIRLFLFEQFLLLFLLTPITGGMALAAHAIVGEKQARTLEPLLATPVTTAELLVAKTIGALMPTLAISAAGVATYFAGIAALAAPGVLQAMASWRTALLLLLVGPAAALVSLQAAMVISSRVNDARTAQQFGVLIILPLTAVLVAQFVGAMRLSATAMAAIGVGLLALWVLLGALSVAVFDRESILTRWK